MSSTHCFLRTENQSICHEVVKLWIFIIWQISTIIYRNYFNLLIANFNKVITALNQHILLLIGNKQKEAKDLINSSGLQLIAEEDLDKAAKSVSKTSNKNITRIGIPVECSGCCEVMFLKII